MFGNTTSQIRLGFLAVEQFLETGEVEIRGGILTTDFETRPIEFHITSSVKPSRTQRVLYGKTLNDYIYAELIGAPLVKGVKDSLDVVLVANEHLLQVRRFITIPLLHISADGPTNDHGPRNIVFREAEEFGADRGFVESILNTIAQKRDLIEPFERLKIALHETHKQKIEHEI